MFCQNIDYALNKIHLTFFDGTSIIDVWER